MSDNFFEQPATPVPAGRSPFWPLLLPVLALLCWFGFQGWQLFNEREQMKQLRAAQDQQVEAAAKVRATLDTMAASTARLADAGNVNARILVEELRRRGITINPAAPAAPAAAPK